MAVLFWIFTKDEPQIRAQRASKTAPKSMWESLKPLKKLQVWRFSLYYFFVFGGFVALALWLPRYYVGVYDMDIKMAGMLAASFSVAGSLFRAVGGYLSDKYGARAVMYWTFFVCSACCFLLAYPQTDYVIHGIKGDIAFSFGWGFIPFTVIVFILGFFMSLGKAAIYKHIPCLLSERCRFCGRNRRPDRRAWWLFSCPFAFGIMNDVLNVWTSCFMLMFALVAIALMWMHITITIMERNLEKSKYLPELGEAPITTKNKEKEHGKRFSNGTRRMKAFWETKEKALRGERSGFPSPVCSAVLRSGFTGASLPCRCLISAFRSVKAICSP
jgi:NNP family nitrate/nitrite transporter-like MFS transporter